MPGMKLTDDLGRTLVFLHPPQRVISLVPSDTYNLIALGYEVRDRIIARATSQRRRREATPPAGSPWEAPPMRPSRAKLERPVRVRPEGLDDGRPCGFVPIWMDPLMTLNADTFGSD